MRPATYIMASRRNGTLYVGVTSDLVKRAYEHRTGMLPGFTSRYGCKLLVQFELHADMMAAITREKQLKGGSRARKVDQSRVAGPVRGLALTPPGLDRHAAPRLAMTYLPSLRGA